MSKLVSPEVTSSTKLSQEVTELENADVVGAQKESVRSSELDSILRRQSAQIESLTNATMALASSVKSSQAQNQRDTAFNEVLEDLKSASRAVQSTYAPPQAMSSSHSYPDTRRCGDCSCVSTSCCTFNIYISSVRALAMQNLEAADSVANPWSEMEVQMFAYLENGIGAVIPSLFSTINVRKLLQYPGVPVTIERLIGQVAIPNGQSKNVVVTVDAIESDAGLAERLTGGRDEEGTAKGALSLNCCSCDDQMVEFDLSFTGGGQGGGTIGIKVIARRSC